MITDERIAVFTPENCHIKKHSDKRKPDISPRISMNLKGKISFNTQIFQLIVAGADVVPMVQFIQDKERTQDWYIMPVSDGGFTLRHIGSSKKYKTHCIQSLKLCALIRESIEFKLPEKGINIMVAKQRVDDQKSPFFGAFPIITKTAKATDPKSRKPE